MFRTEHFAEPDRLQTGLYIKTNLDLSRRGAALALTELGTGANATQEAILFGMKAREATQLAQTAMSVWSRVFDRPRATLHNPLARPKPTSSPLPLIGLPPSSTERLTDGSLVMFRSEHFPQAIMLLCAEHFSPFVSQNDSAVPGQLWTKAKKCSARNTLRP